MVVSSFRPPPRPPSAVAAPIAAFDADHLAKAVGADMDAVFNERSPAIDSLARPPLAATPPWPRRLLGAASGRWIDARRIGGVGALAAAVLAGVAIGSALPRSGPHPAAAAVRVDTAEAARPAMLQVMTVAPPAPVVPRATDRMETLPPEEAVTTAPSPAVIPARRPQPAAPLAAPSPPTPSSQPASARDDAPACAPGEACDDADLEAAQRDLAQAYGAARQAGIPARVLQRDRADWRGVRDAAGRRSRQALLAAYDAQIGSIETMIDDAAAADREADRERRAGFGDYSRRP